MIIVDGEAVNSGGHGGDEEDARRAARLELKLCKALVALEPPHELSVILHGRIAQKLRSLRNSGMVDEDVREVASLSDAELREAAGIVRAIRALPWWTSKGIQGTHSFRVLLSGYALDLADEIDKRGTGRDKA